MQSTRWEKYVRQLLNWLRGASIRPDIVLMLSATAGLFAGCNREAELYPATGKVVYGDGTPIPGGSLELTSIDAQPARMARGIIQTDGTFQLETILASGPAPGAAAGKHRVLVSPPMRSERDPPSWRPAVHPRFGSYDSSALEIEIRPEPNELTIQVDRP